MKRILLAAAVMLAPLAAHAQDANAGAASNAQVAANQQTLSAAKTGDYTVNNYGGGTLTTRQSGTATARIESAPALGSLALGGGHPCAYAPVSIQASIIGGAAGVGGMQVDDVCMLFLLGAQGNTQAQRAAVILMAGGDMDTCRAMEQAGMGVQCLTRKEARAAKAKAPVTSTRSASAVAFSVDCQNRNGKITPVVSREVMETYGRAAVMNACR